MTTIGCVGISKLFQLLISATKITVDKPRVHFFTCMKILWLINQSTLIHLIILRVVVVIVSVKKP